MQAHELVDTLVLGAGVAGLTAAYQLKKMGRSPLVLEADPEIGGRVKTRTVDGIHFNMGAGFLNSGYKNTTTLLKELGLETTSLSKPELTTAYGGRIHRSSFGHLYKLFIAQPLPLATKLKFFLRAPFVLNRIRQHHLHDLASLQALDDQNAYDVMSELLGKEVVDLFIDPMGGSMIFQSIKDLSLSSFYAFVHMALLTAQYGLPTGLSDLPDKLAEGLTIRCDSNVISITEHNEYVEVIYLEKQTGESKTVHARQVISALPADVMAKVLTTPTETERDMFENIQYGKCIAVIGKSIHDLCFMGTHLVFPIEENRIIAGISKHSRGYYIINLRDEATTEALQCGEVTGEKLASLIKSSSRLFHSVDLTVQDFIIWRNAIPKYSSGHNRRLTKLIAEEPTKKRLFLAGDYMMSPNVEGAVTTGTRAAQLLMATSATVPQNKSAA